MKRFLKSLECTVRDVIAWVLGRSSSVRKVSIQDVRRAFETGQIKKILLVRTYQGMGDLLCATPVISNIRSRFPNVSIHFLANTFNKAALDGNPKIDRIWAWDERAAANPAGWARLLGGLRKEKFDAAFILSSNALSLTAILLAFFSGARWVIGYETQAYAREWGCWLYHCEVPYENPLREIDKFLGFWEGLGFSCQRRDPEYFVSALHREFADRYLRKNFPENGRPRVGIFLGGKTDRPERIWPPENYAEVARRLVESTGCEFVLIMPPGSSQGQHRRESTFWLDEKIHGERFRKAFSKPCLIFQEADLGRVAALISQLDLLVCPDGGIMHLAAAVRTPTLALFFGTDPLVWHPMVPSSHYLKAFGGDPRTLSPDQVTKEAERWLLPRSVKR